MAEVDIDSPMRLGKAVEAGNGTVESGHDDDLVDPLSLMRKNLLKGVPELGKVLIKESLSLVGELVKKVGLVVDASGEVVGDILMTIEGEMGGSLRHFLPEVGNLVVGKVWKIDKLGWWIRRKIRKEVEVVVKVEAALGVRVVKLEGELSRGKKEAISLGERRKLKLDGR